MAEFIGGLLVELILGLGNIPWARRLRAVTTLKRCEARLRGKGLDTLPAKTTERWEVLLTDAQECWFEYNLREQRIRIDTCVAALSDLNSRRKAAGVRS